MPSFYDSLYNSFSTLFSSISGVGTSDDISKNISISENIPHIGERDLVSLYIHSGLIQKIVDLIPTLATECHVKIDVKNGKKISITDLEIQNHIDSRDIKNIFLKATVSARIFGESYLLIDVADNTSISEELIIDSDTYLNTLYFLEFGAIEPVWNRQSTEILNYKIGYSSNEKYKNVNIHPSRVLVFGGKTLTPKMQMYNNGYHASVVKSIAEAYFNIAQSLNVSTSLIARVATFVFKMNGLREIIKDENSEALVSRLRQHKIGIGSTGGICIDGENEEVEWLGINLQGIPEIITRLEDFFTANTELSHDMLWNEGSNSTSSDLENVNTQRKIRSFIREYWSKNFNKVAKIICNELLDTIDIDFELVLPEPQLTLADNISAKEGQARVDNMYITTGVLDAKSVRESRFNTDSPFDTFISTSSDFTDIDNPKIESVEEKKTTKKTPVKDDIFTGVTQIDKDIQYKKPNDILVSSENLQSILDNLKEQNPTIYSFAIADLDDE